MAPLAAANLIDAADVGVQFKQLIRSAGLLVAI
jgi:hypothetical protein